MDSVAGFHREKRNGKIFLVYHHPKYQPIPQTQIPTSSSVEADRPDNSLQPLFLCPTERWEKDYTQTGMFLLKSCPEYVLSTTRTEQDKHSVDEHPVLPLFWCNNKEFADDGGCNVCRGSNFGTDYYFCESHNETYHKECVESPLQIKQPYHPDHSLQLCFRTEYDMSELFTCCGRNMEGFLIYCCLICKVIMHPICAMQPIPFSIDNPKRHNHPLTFFTIKSKSSLDCNVCGLLRKFYPTYVCVLCNFVAHKDCMNSPSIIKISRHRHRISYVSSLPSGEWSCGVCRQSIDGDYGAYSCDKCSDYVVHSRCAIGKDVWDGIDLEGVPEKDYTIQDNVSYEIISEGEGVIRHFLHDHHLMLEVSKFYDENKICQACVLPIYEGKFYSCSECDFILHESCANAPREIQHAIHPHLLTLEARITYCKACWRNCDGFFYQCPVRKCYFRLDVRCASISEPLDYEGHEHPLFLALNRDEKPTCKVCKKRCSNKLNCIKCDFIVCFECVTLPYKVRFKYDEHFLTLLWGKELGGKDWCEVCECNLKDTNTERFYWCNECSTILHIECLFGRQLYRKPKVFIKNV